MAVGQASPDPGERAAELLELGRPDEALAVLEEALRQDPDDVDLLLDRASVLFELCRFAEARAQLSELVVELSDEAWIHHMLGLLAERRGDPQEAARRLARAHELDPEEFPRPVEMSAREFDGVVEDAIRSLPEPVRHWLENVAVAVEDIPQDEDLVESDPPLSPTILGVFRGSPLGEKASADPWSHFPSSIVLYQKNLQRCARDRDELVEEIGTTLLHEVGHFLGLDEDELRERGLE